MSGEQLNLVLCLSLSQQARSVSDMSTPLLLHSQSFLISQDPWDAARVASTLRRIEKIAGIAALSFEAAAKSGGVQVETHE